MRKSKRQFFSLGAALASCALTALAQPVGQWDFNGNLNATVGGTAIQYADGANGPTQAGTVFGTTTELGLPDIGGTPASVMKFPAAATPDIGYLMPVNTGSNGGEKVNSYTIIFDLLFPTESDSKWRALLETDNRVLQADAEILINESNGLGGSGSFSGKILPNTWHRVGIVVDAETRLARKYIDGLFVGSQGVGNADGPVTLEPFGNAILFTDDNAQSAVGYVNSIQLRDVPLTTPEMRAMGGAQAAGIPQQIPPIPSGIERWIPGGEFASRNTTVGAVIALGSATIQDSTITISLNGAVLNRTITRDTDFVTALTAAQSLTPGEKYTNVVRYTDSLAGAKSFTNVFTAAIYFEDFEGVTLGASVEEGVAAEGVWTKTPPAGWSLVDTNMAGFDSPDDDGDGRPDLDGRSEWFGWSFANKDWWVQTAGDQDRSKFSLGLGTVAIADPDEWDDSAHAKGLFNATMTTPDIALDGVAPNTAFLRFDSSWRDESFDDGSGLEHPTWPTDANGNPINNQTGIITVSYDGGAEIQVLKWDSKQGSPTFHDDFPNETVLVLLNNPAGARTAKITFAMVEAANDWWWAVDNLAVAASATAPIISAQPVGKEVNEGDAASLTVTASGSGLTYQWFKGVGSAKTAVAGATGAMLNLSALRIEDGGYYSVEVKNSVGTTSSGIAKISVLPSTAGRLVLLDENFESLALGPNVDESLAGEQVWTKTGPEGWTIDDSGVPGAGTDGDGVTEWAGWSFAKREWWAQTAGDQQRSQFVRGVGTVAVVDSDEWDDIGHDEGNMDTSLKTKAISLQGVKANSVILKYDSSWRPEEPQRASVTVSFDGGAPIDLIQYHSTPANANFRTDETSETIALRVPNPANAQNMVLTFRYFDTRNNWWWAIDNILVMGDKAPLFSENFDALVLGPNVDEALAGTAVWTSTTPAGWSVDNTGTPGLNDPLIGVREWEGWNFASRAWWAQTAGDQQRSQFLKGTGTIAIADGDEWDDKGDPDSLGKMSTFLSTRAIDVSSAAANTLVLKFDSSWRDEADQKVNIRAAYDGGTPAEVLRWEASGPNFHDDAPNESVSVRLNNPAGARNLVLTFGYFDAGNNWWWAIDNIEVTVEAAQEPELRLTLQKSGNNLVITAAGSGSLQLQKKTKLTDATWTNVGTPSTTGTFTVAPEGATGFLRVARP